MIEVLGMSTSYLAPRVSGPRPTEFTLLALAKIGEKGSTRDITTFPHSISRNYTSNSFSLDINNPKKI